MYIGGAQEAFTYQAGYQDLNLKIATKCYPMGTYTHTAASLRGSLETSLAELQTPCVDIFYLHAADRRVPFEETLQCCDEMYREGKFRQLGVSNYTAYELAEVVTLCRERGWVRPTVYQGMYNFITRGIERELVPACRRYGLDIVVYNPVAGGLLSSKFEGIAAAHEKSAAPVEGRYSDSGPTGGIYRGRYFRDPVLDSIKGVKEAADAHGITLLETALRWLVHHSALKMGDSGNDGILIGVSSMQQLEENIKELEKGPLPEEVLQALEKAWENARGSATEYVTNLVPA